MFKNIQTNERKTTFFFIIEYKIMKYLEFLSTQTNFGTKKALNEIADEFLAIGSKLPSNSCPSFPPF